MFRNEENGYTVFHLGNDDGEVTCVGNFNFINEGELLELSGEYVNHNVYGTQLKVISHTVKEPEDIISIESIWDPVQLKVWVQLWPAGS